MLTFLLAAVILLDELENAHKVSILPLHSLSPFWLLLKDNAMLRLQVVDEGSVTIILSLPFPVYTVYPWCVFQVSETEGQTDELSDASGNCPPSLFSQ